jgi:AcrR family transcriptional regulator
MPPDTAGRDGILDAAERVFARQGFAATTIKQIGAEARVNSALLYYYFDDKESLYRAVLGRAITTLGARMSGALEHARSPDDAIRAFTRAQTEVIIEHPTLPRILIRELFDHEASHAEPASIGVAVGAFQRLCDIIRHGQRDGRFRADLDPRFAAISVIAQVVYFNVARPAVGILLGYGPGGITAATARDFGEHAGAFALAALAAPAAPARERTATRRARRS